MWLRAWLQSHYYPGPSALRKKCLFWAVPPGSSVPQAELGLDMGTRSLSPSALMSCTNCSEVRNQCGPEIETHFSLPDWCDWGQVEPPILSLPICKLKINVMPKYWGFFTLVNIRCLEQHTNSTRSSSSGWYHEELQNEKLDWGCTIHRARLPFAVAALTPECKLEVVLLPGVSLESFFFLDSVAG